MSPRRPRQDDAVAASSDQELVAACLLGDERAWDALVDRYAAYIYAVALRGFGFSRDAAEEVFSDVCVRLYDGLRGYSGTGEFRSWLRAVVVSAGREYLRRESRRPSPEVEPSEPDRIDELETAIEVRTAVASLGEPCATTVSLHFFADLTQAEVASRLKVPSGTVAARISRCLRRLRDTLQEPAAGRTSRG